MSDAQGPDDAVAKAQGRLGHLKGEVATMRAVLVQLLQDVVRAEGRLDQGQASQLREANAQLVVSALDAQADAEIAHGALDEASRTVRLDPLTSLPNRTLLLDRFESAISHARRHGNRVALLFLDLDGFKRINDSFGHAAGDQALKLAAECLSSLVRETDTVSRHGGDEFLILLSEVARATDAALLAGKVNAALGAQRSVGGHPVRLIASIGISVYPEDGEDTKTLIDRADAAMYLAKKQGLGGFVFHDHRSPIAHGMAAADAIEIQRDLRASSVMATIGPDERHAQLREANAALVLAALGAQELLAAAEDAKRRQAELLAMMANELNDPFAPIRLAAAALGISGVQSTLLARVHEVIDEQAQKMSRMVREVLDQQSPVDLS